MARAKVQMEPHGSYKLLSKHNKKRKNSPIIHIEFTTKNYTFQFWIYAFVCERGQNT